MKNMQTIIRKLEELKPLLEERFAVDTIGVFGSYPKGGQREDSDLDILVSFSQAVSLFKFIELEDFLSGEMGITVDLVMKDVLKPRIRERILQEVVYL